CLCNCLDLYIIFYPARLEERFSVDRNVTSLLVNRLDSRVVAAVCARFFVLYLRHKSRNELASSFCGDNLAIDRGSFGPAIFQFWCDQFRTIIGADCYGFAPKSRTVEHVLRFERCNHAVACLPCIPQYLGTSSLHH